MNRVVSLLLILLFVFSCDNEEDAINEVEEDEPAITEIGEPTGSAVTKEIGPGGGIVSSADGKLDVSVPTGAVTTNTVFSIQPITNFCPGRRNAYRLLPDGLTFATPVTLTFRYTDGEIANTSTDFLGIAFQADDGIWYRVPTEIDNSAKTITTKATHFTDWSVLSQLWISPTVPYLPEIEAGSTFALELIGFEDNSPPPNGPPSPAPQGDDLPSLPTPAPLRVQWYVNGVDSGNPNVGRIIIVAGANNQKVEYEAPATAPANNPVAVSAKLTGFRTWDFVNRRRRTFNEVILFKHIKIRDEWNYTLKIADTKLLYLACALQMTYLDSVKMDVHVKGQNVTITNIVNQAPVIDPMSNTNYCTITCDPGPFGSLNVSQGSGEKWPARDPVDGYFRFNLTLQHQSRGAGGKYLLECPDQDDLLVPSTPYTDTETHLTFILADSIQSVGSVGISYTLTPKGN